MKQPFIRALMIGGILLSVACVWPLQQWGEETTFRPKTTSFDPSTLKKEQVTVLNAVVGFGLEGYAHQVSRSLSSALDQRPTLILSLPVHDALNRINRAGLTEEYTSMVSDYVRTGILNRAGLEKLDRQFMLPTSFSPVSPRSANPCPGGFRSLVCESCKPASPRSV